MQKLSQGVVNQVLENEDTTRLVVALLQRALQDPATVQSFLEFLEYVFAQDNTRDALRNLVNSVMATDGFLKSTAEMSNATVHSVLDDKWVQDHAAKFCIDVS